MVFSLLPKEELQQAFYHKNLMSDRRTQLVLHILVIYNAFEFFPDQDFFLRRNLSVIILNDWKLEEKKKAYGSYVEYILCHWDVCQSFWGEKSWSCMH